MVDSKDASPGACHGIMGFDRHQQGTMGSLRVVLLAFREVDSVAGDTVPTYGRIRSWLGDKLLIYRGMAGARCSHLCD